MKEAGYDPREATKIWKILAATTNNTTLMDEITNKTNEYLNSADNWDKDFDASDVKTIVDKKILPTLFSSIYASHPRAIKRYQNLNFIIATNYAKDELSELEVGKDYFKEVVKRLSKP